MNRMTLSIFGIMAAISLFTSGCGSEEKKAWQEVRQENTIGGYRTFIKENAGSKYVRWAEKGVDSLRLERLPGFQNARSASLEIVEDYGGAKVSFIPEITEIVKRCLNKYGIEIDPPDSDLRIAVTISGRAISAGYTGTVGKLYTGTSVSGSISFVRRESPAVIEKFERVSEPPPVIQSSYTPDTPEDAAWRGTLFPAVASATLIICHRCLGNIGPLLWARFADDHYPEGTLNSLGIRIGAFDALGTVKDPRSVEPLIASLGDPDWYRRREAATALEMMDSLWWQEEIARKKIPELISQLTDKSQLRRCGAAYTLGYLKEPQVVEPLITALRHPETREAAATALGMIKDRRAVVPLIASLKNRELPFSGSIVFALGEIGDPRAVEPLIAVLRKDPTNIDEALHKITGVTFFGNGGGWHNWWEINREKYVDQP